MSTGSETAMLKIVLLRLLSHHAGTTIGRIAIESNISANGITLQPGKYAIDFHIPFPETKDFTLIFSPAIVIPALFRGFADFAV